MQPTNITGLSFAELSELVSGLDQPAYRARQVFANILQRGIRVGKKKERELNEIIEDILE